MKALTRTSLLIIAFGISSILYAQENMLLQKLPMLNEHELAAIKNKLSVNLTREASTRTADQFNVVILSGADESTKLATARYLAQQANASFYKVDLSMVVAWSFQVTKNNIDLIFETTQNENCLLYFEEGEALFGSRDTVSSSHDKYANEEIHYFLHQVDKYRGSVIISIVSQYAVNPLIFEKYVLLATEQL